MNSYSISVILLQCSLGSIGRLRGKDQWESYPFYIIFLHQRQLPTYIHDYPIENQKYTDLLPSACPLRPSGCLGIGKQNLQQLFITKTQEMGCGTSSQSTSNVSLPHQASSSSLPKRDLYDRKDMIGVGHHGRVYRAVHQLTGKEYAVKVVDRLAEGNALLGARERRALGERLKKLKNSLIAPYLQVQGGAQEVALVMELSREGTLKKYIQKNGKLPEEKVSKIIGLVLQGLNYLHGCGILHKDLKPSNILMVNGEGIQLSDYALAELYDERLSGKADSKRGIDFSRGESLPYMAPEVIRHEGISQKADVWSVGCTVIQMLTGKVPWIEINPKFEKAFKEITGKAIAPLPKDISADCRSFLERCLTINVAKRWGVNELLKHPFIPSMGTTMQAPPSEVEVDKVKVSLERTDTANRINSRNSNKKDSPPPASSPHPHEQNLSTPPSIQKTIKKDSNQRLTKDLSHSKEQRPAASSDQLRRLKQAVGNFKVKRSRDGKTIQNEDILPQIEQEQEGVMLNNRRVKLHPGDKVKTEQTDVTQKREYRHSIQLQENPSSLSLNHYRPVHKQWDHSESSKLQTEPAHHTSTQIDRDMEYFKKPLKLLKKKLKARQKDSRARYLDNSDETYANEDEALLPDQEPPHQQSKIRTLSQQREQLAINTQLAKAERDRYINQQLVMRRQKQKQKAKWQQQLKQEAQVIKKEFSHRYAYQKYHPVLNMI